MVTNCFFSVFPKDAAPFKTSKTLLMTSFRKDFNFPLDQIAIEGVGKRDSVLLNPVLQP